MNHVRLLGLLPLLCLAALLACSSSPTAGGGSDLPNGTVLATVTGTVLSPDSTPAVGAEVVLRKIVVAPAEDSVVAEYTALVGSDGVYAFDSVPKGRYALVAGDTTGTLGAFEQSVEIVDTVDTALAAVALAPLVDLVGFVELPPGFYYSRAGVRVPGSLRQSAVDINRMYLLENVPRGSYDIAFTYDSVVNYLRVRVAPRTENDTVAYVRNVRFAVMDVMADSGHEFHASRMQRSYAIAPRPYDHGEEPPWYQAVDLSHICYYLWDGETLREWRPESATVSSAYDTLLSGVVYRDGRGRERMETVDGQVVTLSGVPAELLSRAQSPYLTVAVLETRIGDQVVYQVVEVLEFSPSNSAYE